MTLRRCRLFGKISSCRKSRALLYQLFSNFLRCDPLRGAGDVYLPSRGILEQWARITPPLRHFLSSTSNITGTHTRSPSPTLLYKPKTANVFIYKQVRSPSINQRLDVKFLTNSGTFETLFAQGDGRAWSGYYTSTSRQQNAPVIGNSSCSELHWPSRERYA